MYTLGDHSVLPSPEEVELWAGPTFCLCQLRPSVPRWSPEP